MPHLAGAGVSVNISKGLVAVVLSVYIIAAAPCIQYKAEAEDTVTYITCFEVGEEDRISYADIEVKDGEGNTVYFADDGVGNYIPVDEGASTITSDKEGNFSIVGLNPEYYYQVYPHQRDSYFNVYEYQSFAAGENVLVEYVKDYGALNISVTDSRSKPLPNASFALLDREGKEFLFSGTPEEGFKADKTGGMNRILTDSDGLIKIVEFPVGEYTLKQDFSSDVYSSHTAEVLVTIQTGETTNIEIEDIENKSTLVITAFDDKHRPAKAQFSLKDKEGNTVAFKQKSAGVYKIEEGAKETVLTPSEGKIEVDNIPTGNYTLVLRGDFNMYDARSEKPILIRSDRASEVEYDFTRTFGTLEIVKNDEQGKPQKGVKYKITDPYGMPLTFKKSINGEHYSVSDDGENTVITNENGKVSISGVPAGQVTIEEFIEDQSQSKNIVTVLKNQKVVYSSSGYIHNIIPVVDENGEKVFVSQLLFKSDSGSYTVDVNASGLADISKIPDGEYNLSTISVPNGYANLKNSIVTIKGNEIAGNQIVIPFASISVQIKGTSESVFFRLEGSNGYAMTIQTNDDGKCVFSNLLNGEYTLTQTTVIDGMDSLIERTIIIDDGYANADGTIVVSLNEISAENEASGFTEFSSETRKKVALAVFFACFTVCFVILTYFDNRKQHKGDSTNG